MTDKYYLNVYDRQSDGRLVQHLELEGLKAAEAARLKLIDQFQAEGKDLEQLDVIIELRSHPSEFHQLGMHGDYVIATGDGILGVWPSQEDEHSFIRLQHLPSGWKGSDRELDELRAACQLYVKD